MLTRATHGSGQHKAKGLNDDHRTKRTMSNMTTSLEEWRAVEGSGAYEVSNKGRVRNKNTGRVRVAKVDDYDGELRVGKLGAVYYLVAKAFLPNPRDLPNVRHLDGDKSNNCVENLEWEPTPVALAELYEREWEDAMDLEHNLASKYYGVARVIPSDGGRVRLFRAYFRASARHKERILGEFTDEKEAERCYDREACRVLGPNAQLNFPEEA
jgi:hypothetical protein